MSVTTAGAAPTRGGISGRRQLIAILVISLALNLCFVAGGLWSRFNTPAAPTAAERFREVAATLKLTPEQKVAFDKYAMALRVQYRKLNADNDPKMMAAWTELAQDHPDQARVAQLLDEAAARRRAFQDQVVTETTELLAAFSPEQRAKFLAEVQQRRTAEHRRQLEGAQ
jgi:uncharacterized membrane protein